MQFTPSSQHVSQGETKNFSLSLSVSYTQGLGAFSLNISAASTPSASARASINLIIEDSGLLCIPGSEKCSMTGNLVECNAQGDGWATKEVCPLGCANGACTTLCKGGAKRCSGSVLQQCRSDGSKWDEIETCANGCDTGALACRTVIGIPPVVGDRRCSGNDTVQQYINGGWMIVEECAFGCFNSTCVAGGLLPIGFDFGVMLLVVIVAVVVGGAGYLYYNTSMKDMTWESLEHKWEVIETNSAELVGNAENFLHKKVRLSGRISEQMQDRTGVMGSTLEDPHGKVLLFSNPPGPKGRVELTGFVNQNEFGEVFVEVESFKTDWLWFLSMLQSLRIEEMIPKIKAYIASLTQKKVKKQ